ncbi:MAG: hypothetical protein O9301_02055 [Leptospira sp.]|nr:hypothetical protein [Leptospira sp.]
MHFRIWFPIAIWTLAVLVANLYLFTRTEESISEYKLNPPFRIEDATGSGGLSRLLDRNLDSFWEKKKQSVSGFDFFLEMKLSHFWNGKEFSPREFKSISLIPCKGQTVPKFRMRFLLRESINVDKELRLPEDLLAFEVVSQLETKTELKIPLTNLPKFLSEKNYPTGIYILTPEFTIQEDSKSKCISEIQINE